MRAWEAILVTVVAMDIEAVDPVHALKFLESVEGHFAGSGDELEQFGTLFFVEGADCTPEPLDLRGRSRVVVILRVDLPVVHIDLGQTRNKQLKLLLREDGNEIWRDNFMET